MVKNLKLKYHKWSKKQPYTKIDWQMVEEMAGMDCTQGEICAVLRISHDTITRACKREHGVDWNEYYAKYKKIGNEKLRRYQWRLAEAGDKAMLIWLGKQRLGQKEPNSRHELTGKDGGPVEIQTMKIGDKIIKF